MEIKEIRLVYIGENFYVDSGSVMSSLYTEAGARYDFGFLQRDLRSGHRVTIRQVTEHELCRYQKLLIEILKEGKK